MHLWPNLLEVFYPMPSQDRIASLVIWINKKKFIHALWLFGYSRLQKGYKCYSPIIRRYYMSADVTFFENTHFFLPSMDYPSSLQQVLSVPSPRPLGNSNQNVSGIPSPRPSSTEVVPPPLITYQRRTQQVD